MYQLVLEINHEITKRLNLKDLYIILLVNKKLSTCVNEPNFWRLKLEHDYNISNKKSYQTWLERYKLAQSMGYICVPNVLNNPTLPFDIGEKVDIGIINDYDDIDSRLFNIRAINAMLVRPGLYYLTDELEFYISGKRTYDDDDVYDNELIDNNVTFIASSLSLILYIKNGDLYVYTDKHKKLRLTFTQNVIYTNAVYNDICYITDNGMCYKIDEFDETEKHNKHIYVKSNVSKVIMSTNGLLALTKDNNFEMIGDFDNNANVPLSGIINIFGFIMFLTSDHKIISFEHIWESDDDSDGMIHFALCSNFENISNVICATEVFCLTKNGDVYYSIGESDIKLSIKAKNIFESPETVVFIV
jgi:hypothetical protein